MTTAKFLILNSSENEALTDEQRQAVQAEDLIRLDVMVGYCKTKDCLRGYILDYFGQAHDARCGNCGSCQAEYTMQDLTREAQMILSCIVRMRSRLGYCVGASLICQTLRGSRAARVRELGLDTLPTYGLMRSLPVPRIRELLELLEAEGYVRTDPVYGGIDTTPLAGQVLFHGQTVEVPVKQSPLHEKPVRLAAAEPDEALLGELKALRLQLARAEDVPAYIILTNAALADMAARRPHTMQELLAVSGVGKAKAARYGEAFLNAVRQFEENERNSE